MIGIFWGCDGPPELGTPPRLYMQVVLAVLDEIEARNPGGLLEDEELQIIAAAGLSMADAGIAAWHYKYSPEHMMWRPVLGIIMVWGRLSLPNRVAATRPSGYQWERLRPDARLSRIPIGTCDLWSGGIPASSNFPRA